MSRCGRWVFTMPPGCVKRSLKDWFLSLFRRKRRPEGKNRIDPCLPYGHWGDEWPPVIPPKGVMT